MVEERRLAGQHGGAPRAVQERDLRGTGWWLLEQLTRSGSVDEKHASVAASVLRVLAGLGPEHASEEEALAEVELRGRLMHGQPPRDPPQWERTTRTFGSDALEEIRGWEIEDLLLERDRGGEVDPLVGGQGAGHDVEVTVLERDEDRGRSHVAHRAPDEPEPFPV